MIGKSFLQSLQDVLRAQVQAQDHVTASIKRMQDAVSQLYVAPASAARFVTSPHALGSPLFGVLECPLCFHHLTVETHYSTMPHVTALLGIQFFCAGGCGFLATSEPRMPATPTAGWNRFELVLRRCPDEPHPGRLKEIEQRAEQIWRIYGP